MSQRGALLLLPNVLGEVRHLDCFLPSSVFKAVGTLDGLIAESEKGGRRYLSHFETKKGTQHTPLALYNEHTQEPAYLDFLLEPILAGERWGLISDAGLPCVADPGSKLVRRAHERGVCVQAFVGPSSLMLALMLSGLSSQKFYFHGYLAREGAQGEEQLRKLAQQSQKEGATQLFIEAPYRSQKRLEMLLRALSDEVELCVAWDLTLPSQGVVVQKIASWKKCTLPHLDKKPAIFLFSAR